MTRRVEVFADVVCPFAYVGLTRILQKLDEAGRDDVAVVVRAWPLEVVNGKPMDGNFIGEEADEIRPQVAPDLFGGFDAAAFPASSIPALALTNAAYEVDGATGLRVAMAVRRAVFEEGRDVADPVVLRQIADEHGVASLGDPATVQADYDEGKARGVVGSPHFFVGDQSMFCPTLRISRDANGHLVCTFDEAKAEEFLGLLLG